MHNVEISRNKYDPSGAGCAGLNIGYDVVALSCAQVTLPIEGSISISGLPTRIASRSSRASLIRSRG